LRSKKDSAAYGRPEEKPSWPLLAGLALVALLAAVSCGAAPEESQAAVDLGHPSFGEEDAPVVLVEYSDLQ
jgi:hypothetical protein